VSLADVLSGEGTPHEEAVMRRTFLTLLAAVAVALPLVPGPAHALSAPQTVTSGKAIPWGIAFLPDGSALFTERNTRRIWEVRPGQPARHVYTVTEAKWEAEGGLLGIAVAKDYAQLPYVYLYYSTATDNRVAQIRRGSAARPKVLLSGIPRASIHNGGRIAFGPDGYLYVGTGDAGRSSLSQDTTSLGGKVLRLQRNGAAAPGNRWGRVYSIGHRNVQGLAFDRSGRLWASELGQSTWDEVNLIRSGANYGWPTVEGRAGDERFVDPVWQAPPSEASPSGIAFKGDSLYVAALRGQRVWRLRTDFGPTVVSASSMLQGTYGRIRAVAQNPRDGSMWVMTSNNDDRVLRYTRWP
jgi:glucose/arabinose dehydrogenase